MSNKSHVPTSDIQDESAWIAPCGWETEERPMNLVRKIVVHGGADVLIFRANEPHLVVAAEARDAISWIKTRIEDDVLVVECEPNICGAANGGTINVGRGIEIQFSGSIKIGGRHVDLAQLGGISSGVKGVVRIALPEVPKIRAKGSANVTLYHVNQASLDVRVRGSGDITAIGQVDHLMAKVSGSGDVHAGGLTALTAKLKVSGSGDIEANVTQSVRARVEGSGDINVAGNPAARDHSVEGSGDITFT